MKKLFLSIAAVLFIVNLSAQEGTAYQRDELQFGFKAGGNFSNVYDSQGEEFDADPKIGLVGGAFVSIPVGKFMGLQPEILLSQKGYRASGSVLGSEYELTRTTTYLDFPLLLALKPIPYLTILAGPQYSFLMKQKYDFNNSILSVTQEEEFENDNIRKNTLGFVGGIDLNFGHVVVGARVSWDITNNNGDGTSTSPRYKNVLGQATLGFRF